MGQFFETIPESLVKWIQEQKMFWVATAPLSGTGHVNVSPKGGDYFGVLDTTTFWYMDLTGSGNETISHLYEPGNARITIMFNAFEGPPRIARLFGTGRVFENGTPSFAHFVQTHGVKTIPGSRAIIIVDVHQVATSCGYSVPFYDFKDFRSTLNDHFAKRVEKYETGKSDESMERYWAYKNAWSVDGLPGLEVAQRTAKTENVAPIQKMVGLPAPKHLHRDNTRQIGLIRFYLRMVIVALVAGFTSTWLARNPPGPARLSAHLKEKVWQLFQ